MKSLKKLIASAFTALGFATIASLAFSAALASAAVTCQQVGPGPTWPLGPYTQFCTGTTQTDGNYLPTAITGNSGSPGQILLRQKMEYQYAHDTVHHSKGVFYVFKNSADFLSWAPSHLDAADIPSAATLAKVAGYTEWTATDNPIPLYTVVFTTIPALNNYQVNQGANLINVAGHESGHWLDALWSPLQPPPGGMGLLPLLSNSPIYVHSLARDWQVLNSALTFKCHSGAGAFNGYQYLSATGVPTYYCDGVNGSGSNLTGLFAPSYSPQNVLQKAWPNIFGYGSDGKRFYNEIFAQTYAIGTMSFTDVGSNPVVTSAFFGGRNQHYPGPAVNLFQCTTAVITWVNNNGSIPTAANLPAGCPAN